MKNKNYLIKLTIEESKSINAGTWEEIKFNLKVALIKSVMWCQENF
jgi:hypothetical protein